jgi:nucleotide-binding universal stress UspA family protein
MNTSVAPGSVVVGVDGSTGSDQAVRWAASHAAAHRRPLTIVHGAGVPECFVAGFPVDVEEATLSLLRAGRAVTDRARDLVRAVDPDLVVDVELDTCEPRSLLAESTRDAHLLVLGSRGHGALLSLLLGSVSVALVAEASCPVVVVRAVDAVDGSLPVVVGVDGTADSTSALTFGFELAAEQRRPLEVVHATGESWLFPVPDTGSVMDADVTADWQVLLAESVAGYGEKFPDVVCTTRLLQGSAAGALVAASGHASTVVVGARGRSALARRLLGSVSRSIVEHAHCTVAVVRGPQA